MIELTETLIHDSFMKNGLDIKFFPVYKTELLRLYNALQVECYPDDEETPDEESNAIASIQLTDEYISYYVQEIEKGHCPQWAAAYAKDRRIQSNEYNNLKTAYDTLPTEKDKERELKIHAESISKDSLYIERYKYLFFELMDDPQEMAERYCKAYYKQINNGHSHNYAHGYADAAEEERSQEVCRINAEAYEQAMDHGMEDWLAHAFALLCSDAFEYGCWEGKDDFLRIYQEDWQKEFYLYLFCKEHRNRHNREMTPWELGEIKKEIYR